jgi:hypothetical protein
VTKQYRSPVQLEESLERLLGWNPVLGQLRDAVHGLFNKRTGGRRPGSITSGAGVTIDEVEEEPKAMLCLSARTWRAHRVRWVDRRRPVR